MGFWDDVRRNSADRAATRGEPVAPVQVAPQGNNFGSKGQSANAGNTDFNWFGFGDKIKDHFASNNNGVQPAVYGGNGGNIVSGPPVPQPGLIETGNDMYDFYNSDNGGERPTMSPTVIDPLGAIMHGDNLGTGYQNTQPGALHNPTVTDVKAATSNPTSKKGKAKSKKAKTKITKQVNTQQAAINAAAGVAPIQAPQSRRQEIDIHGNLVQSQINNAAGGAGRLTPEQDAILSLF